MANSTVSRPVRVAQEVRRTLATLLLQEAKDPRFQNITITDCQVSKDLSIAKIHFSLIGHNSTDPEVEQTLKALDKAKGFLRSEIGKRLKLRIVPDLRFYFDTVPENVQYMEDLINKALNKK
ncbi:MULTISPECIES: 30S ribosome-binding factor RbfA [Thiomicrorhabdus]|uniref:Ribosome-binding factor A n=1 Tax=Thiomicrorhabdus xiamenensis TaxID=2739063 RepID=A0A7D4NYF0_9GAMM|nr:MULTISPECIES: 30S ribosome-binding factor RbfA [Thiomicrorhabdus]MBO1924011.1 30S ribosome-binding factor RbfA [Thiomicrorhabdus sp. 6S3-12]QKI89098.1 30S ribosome-binding factor RbfA [Thiomicrorhabdus xiamenensis]